MNQFPSDLRSDQLAPHSIEAEEAVLGGVLLDSQIIALVSAVLKPEDFFIIRHGWIFEAMLTLANRRDPVDQLTVVTELEQSGRLSETGGAAYIISLVNKTVNGQNVEGYAHIVERMATRRRMIEAAQVIARVAHSDETDIEECVTKATTALGDAVGHRSARAARSLRELMSEHYDITARLMMGERQFRGMATGFVDLDRQLSGIKDGELIVPAGRPGMGKTALMLAIARYLAQQGTHVGIMSYEMSELALAGRLASMESRIPYSRIDNGRLTEREWVEYSAAYDRAQRLPIDIQAAPNPEIGGSIRQATQMIVGGGAQVLMLDYLQKLRAKSDNRSREIGIITQAYKALAMAYKIPVILLSQLNRGVESRTDKRPLLSDLRESGDIEQDADVVLFLYRDGYYNPDSEAGNAVEIDIAKNRNGATGMVKLAWMPEIMSFENAVMEHHDLDLEAPRVLGMTERAYGERQAAR